MKKNESPFHTKIEQLRHKLLSDKRSISYKDVGTASKHFNTEVRSLNDIASTSLLPAKWAQLLYRIAFYNEAHKIIELGTSMGLTSLYLASVPAATVFTFEGNTSMTSIAETHFEFFNISNINLVAGNIDQTLPDHLQNPAKVHFAFIDANHKYQATVHYFELLCKRMADKGIMVIDDIHQSSEMEKAWNEVKGSELVYGSVDLFRMGVLFFDLSLNKQHYIWTL